MTSPFDARPIVLAVAGPNGAGKTTFYEALVAPAGLRFVNADDLARELELDPYAAAEVAAGLRERLLEQGESFVYETVFSDPVGEKVALLRSADGEAGGPLPEDAPEPGAGHPGVAERHRP